MYVSKERERESLQWLLVYVQHMCPASEWVGVWKIHSAYTRDEIEINILIKEKKDGKVTEIFKLE